jgi:hypothetical protein
MKRSGLNSVGLDKFIRNEFEQLFAGPEGAKTKDGICNLNSLALARRAEYKYVFCNPGVLNTIVEFQCHVHRY